MPAAEGSTPLIYCLAVLSLREKLSPRGVKGAFWLGLGTFLSLATEAAHWYRMANAPIERSCYLGRFPGVW